MVLCRLCYLENNGETSKNIFDEKPDPPIWRMLMDLANLIIVENDPYTKIVCFDCFDKLIKFHSFRNTILENDRKFKDNYQQSNFNQTCTDIDRNCPNIKMEIEDNDYGLVDEKVDVKDYQINIANDYCQFSNNYDDDQNDGDDSLSNIDDKNHIKKIDIEITDRKIDDNDDGVGDDDDDDDYGFEDQNEHESLDNDDLSIMDNNVNNNNGNNNNIGDKNINCNNNNEQRKIYEKISNEKRQIIIDNLNNGYSIKTVAQLVNIKPNTVSKIYSRYKKYGRIFKMKTGHRPKLLTDEMKEQLCKWVDEKSTLTLRELRCKLLEKYPQINRISETTIANALDNLSFFKRRKFAKYNRKVVRHHL